MGNRLNNRIIPIFSTTTIEELNNIISAIENHDYAWEYVHGRSGVYCIRYWDKNGDFTNEVV